MLRLSALTRRRQRVHVRSRAMLDLNQAMICRSRLIRSPRSAEVARGFRAASHLSWIWVVPRRTSCWVNSTSRNHWYKYYSCGCVWRIRKAPHCRGERHREMDATARNMNLRERRRGRDLLFYCSGTGAGTLSDGASESRSGVLIGEL